MALVTVFGGTGFLGRRVVECLTGQGETVRVAARHPTRVRAGGAPGGSGRTVAIVADVRDEAAVAAAIAGADAVINAVSTYLEKADVTYEAVHVHGATHVAHACERQGVSRLVHISGIGADPGIAFAVYPRAGPRRARGAAGLAAGDDPAPKRHVRPRRCVPERPCQDCEIVTDHSIDRRRPHATAACPCRRCRNGRVPGAAQSERPGGHL